MQVLNAGTRAKILMLERGIRPRDVAQAVGLEVNYVYRLLSGHCVTKVGRAKLEKFFGVNLWSDPAQEEAKAA